MTDRVVETATEANIEAARRLAQLLTGKEAALVEAWWKLGATGPTLGSSEAGSAEEARQRFLRPLARLLIGGLGGSDEHSAVYLDERLRYVEDSLSPQDQRSLFLDHLAIEIPAIAQLVSDQLDPEIAREILTDFHASLTDQQEPKVKVLFIGDCLFVETRAFLAPAMERGDCPIETSHVFFSAAQQVESMNAAVIKEITRWRPDVIGISLFTFEGVPLYRAAWRSAAAILPSHRSASLVEGLVGTLHRLIDDIRTVTEATIVLHSPAGLPLDPVRRRIPFLAPHSRAQTELRSTLGRRVAELAEASANVAVLDEAGLVDQQGGLRAMARPLFAPADVPAGYAHPSRLGPEVASAYGSLLADFDLLGAAKVLLVDFDNTLWRGVMGDGAVEHYPERQQLLLELKAAGVLLVAVSKNDQALIRWGEMALQEADFALTKINWRPKADNVAESVIELDLSASTFVLVDDNPVERSLVTDQVAGVRALDATDERTWRTLRNWLRFPSTAQTEEARRRTSMYREAAARRGAMSKVGDYGAMMRSLKLKHTVRLARSRDVERILELVQRTNQFNTTTHRRSLAEIHEIIKSEDTGVYVASLSDRFGDLGVVAVAVFERRARLFESVIMSCRAMGFGLEIALLRAVMDDEGDGPFYGRFAPTERNRPAADLFERAGFASTGESDWALVEGSLLPAPPEWLT